MSRKIIAFTASGATSTGGRENMGRPRTSYIRSQRQMSDPYPCSSALIRGKYPVLDMAYPPWYACVSEKQP